MSGVRSSGAPPVAGTVQRWSGVRTSVLVERKASVASSPVQAMPEAAVPIAATGCAPLAEQISIEPLTLWCPSFGVCSSMATRFPS